MARSNENNKDNSCRCLHVQLAVRFHLTIQYCYKVDFTSMGEAQMERAKGGGQSKTGTHGPMSPVGVTTGIAI